MGSIVHEFIDEFGRKRRIFFRRRNATMLELIQNNSSGLVTSWSSIKGLWIFDQTGATSTISDMSGNSHDITLRDGSLNAINASTCSPGVTSMAPYLTFDATHVWNTPDHNDFTFALSPFTILSLIYPTLVASCEIVAKQDNTTGSTQKEYITYLNDAGALYCRLYDNTNGGYIGRSTPVGSVAANTWQSVIWSDDGTTANGGVKIYVNATKVDNANSGTGTFTTMRNTTSLVGAYSKGTEGAVQEHFRGSIAVIAIIAEELTSTQITVWDRILRASAGVTV